MRQQSFAADDFEKYRKKTRKEVFLEEMDQIIPGKALSKVISRLPQAERCRQKADWDRTDAAHPFSPALV